MRPEGGIRPEAGPTTDQAALVAAVVVDELVRGGVRTFLYCPGSRNGPLGFELSRRAEAGELRLHVRLDERSAAFVALGMAKSTGAPVAVVTTSGSAVANLAPAAAEADYARIPLVLVTANRPPQVLGTGASQTVDQTRYLLGQVRHVQVLGGGGEPPEQANATLRSQVCRALAIAAGRLMGAPGPVQIDVPLPSGLPPSARRIRFPKGRPQGGPWTRIPARTPRRTTAHRIDLTRRTLVVAGDGADLTRIPEQVPCIAEPTVPTGGRTVLHPWVLDYARPEQLVVLGRPTLHRNVSRALARPDTTTVLVSDGDDDWVYAAPSIDTVTAQPVFTGETPRSWTGELTHLDEVIRDHWSRALHHRARPLTGADVAATLLSALRPGDILWLGASNPIRDVSLTGTVPHGVQVLSSRGVAGIDGNISSAVGAALASPSATVIALIGDLTFAHDASGLMSGHLEQVPDNLVVVVSNDAGGGIFELLEQGHPAYRHHEFGDTFERIYGTPQHIDIAPLCQAYGVSHRKAHLEALPDSLDKARAENRIAVVEVPVARTTLRDVHTAVRHSIDATWDAAPAAARSLEPSRA
ncbi:2-succinyl-5-enolpyruvyl-6-hydroxy-3-cyclohexene-1-carboxylic-acid synthase [Streptacidiphilus pinicola]|uniref:2-succinyl-5-enolpyruvyl-6-hydroxy-3-cyclohexene-1-carboxylate synthase n=1 Tax=Streptacidiphilus pinicola TaxID=2219663 RepID=A0A2X0IJT0_9ACTN|nr:2-succinyl-5-enolpyruvyl-6-hydroxy-3-cyclohexene-1-carboxylic-acid synthase [Streptacidiphilus pinicola]RAG85302.1 2-succinyl-5-enolpyruvyl-6-hydroxy-3-cyclohexene-1-carboxylic-acid synthase [Streptacidiphilus pinicola]